MTRPKKSPRKPTKTVEGAGGVVVNGSGRVLMIRHRNGAWVFPKGHIEAGESKVDAALREVEEEAGVVANVHDPRMTWQTAYVNPRREARRITWYLLTTDATETVQREPLFPEGGFFSPGLAMRRLAFDEDRNVLRGALKAAARAGLVEHGEDGPQRRGVRHSRRIQARAARGPASNPGSESTSGGEPTGRQGRDSGGHEGP